ncbi:MAG: hypothetical protein ACI9IJ_000601, partial [Psychromonas sp.]
RAMVIYSVLSTTIRCLFKQRSARFMPNFSA